MKHNVVNKIAICMMCIALTGCSSTIEPQYAYDRIEVHRNEQSGAWVNLKLRSGYLVQDYVVDYETMTVTINLERTEEAR